MFSITIKASNLKGLRESMHKLGVEVEVDDTFSDHGVRVLEVSVGEGEFNPRIAKAAQKYQF